MRTARTRSPQELGDLPLGLAQAAATIGRQHLTYSTYLQRLRQVPVRELLGRGPGEDYPHATAAALLLSVQATEASDPTGLAGWLLRVLAALSPDGIPRGLLDGLPRVRPGRRLAVFRRRGSRRLAWEVDAAIERCVAGSLLEWSVAGDAVIMHRLLARVLRERDQARGQWDRTVTAALNLLEPLLFSEAQAWSRREEGARLGAQVEALWDADAGAGTGDRDLALRQLRARSWAVRQLRASADLSRAITTGIRTLADCERVLGADHPETLGSRNNLAGAYQAAGRLDQAIPLYERTLADCERVLGADHPDTLGSRNNLAYAYQAAGRLDQAIPLYERTLADCERVLGADHPHTLASRNNLAGAYRAAGRLDQAIPLYERTLADCERVLGADHPDTLTSRNNLAYAYRVGGPAGPGDPAVRADPGRLRAGAGRRPPGHARLAEQPRGRLPGGGPAGPGDPAVRADPGRPRAGAGRRPPAHARLAEQPRGRLPVGGPAGPGDPAVRADPGRLRAGAGRRPPGHARPRGTTSNGPESRVIPTDHLSRKNICSACQRRVHPTYLLDLAVAGVSVRGSPTGHPDSRPRGHSDLRRRRLI